MTANDLLRKLQKEVGKLSTGDIPVRLDDHFVAELDVELCEGKEGYYINIKPIYF